MDIDGPMIPLRAYGLSTNKCPVDKFDPCATDMVMQLIEKSSSPEQQTKIVCSSTWGYQGLERFSKLLLDNHIPPTLLHDDWITPRKMSSYRCHEVRWWLERHPEITHYVAIDDERLHEEFVPNAVLCDGYEGFSFRNMLECKVFLEIYEGNEDHDKLVATINYHKQREIWRATDRIRHERAGHLNELARTMFDPIDKDLSC